MNKRINNINTREIVLISMLAVIIAISGSLKIPAPFMGTEFQMSAPIAVAICAYFGFKRYILAGIIASSLTLLMGTHTIINVTIAMSFRIAAGAVLSVFGPRFLAVSIAGPVGSIAARIVIWLLMGKGLIPMIISAIPGMIFTAIASPPLYKMIVKTMKNTSWGRFSYGKNI